MSDDIIEPEALGEEGTPLHPDLQGRKLMIQVEIAYPGSRVSDIYIGNDVYHIDNDLLRQLIRRLK